MINHIAFERIEKRFEAMTAQMQSPEQVAAMELLCNASEADIRAILDAHYSCVEGRALFLNRR